jgi:hypothetical protein
MTSGDAGMRRMDEPRERRTAGPFAAASEGDGADAFRRDLLADLPGLIGRAMRGYRRFTMDRPPEDPKGFIAYQAGCRAALTHIHLLLKLASWAMSSHPDETSMFDAEQLEGLVREAEAALHNDPIDED